MNVCSLPSWSEYMTLDDVRRHAICALLAKQSAGLLELVDIGKDDGLLPTFWHNQIRLQFKLVLGGEFFMGFSENEEKAARHIIDPLPLNLDEMRPTKHVDVAPFLASSRPVLVKEYLTLGGEGIDRSRIESLQAAHQSDYPACVTHEQATTFAQCLGCRLPFETEWEYLCRGGTQTLFVWGDKVPDDAELAQWLVIDFSGQYCTSRWSIPGFSEGFRLRCNAFGFYGLFAGEWCQDEYRMS